MQQGLTPCAILESNEPEAQTQHYWNTLQKKSSVQLLTLLQTPADSRPGRTFRMTVLATRWPCTARTAGDFRILGSTAPTDCNPPKERRILSPSGSRGGLCSFAAARGNTFDCQSRWLRIFSHSK